MQEIHFGCNELLGSENPGVATKINFLPVVVCDLCQFYDFVSNEWRPWRPYWNLVHKYSLQVIAFWFYEPLVCENMGVATKINFLPAKFFYLGKFHYFAMNGLWHTTLVITSCIYICIYILYRESDGKRIFSSLFCSWPPLLALFYSSKILTINSPSQSVFWEF